MADANRAVLGEWLKLENDLAGGECIHQAGTDWHAASTGCLGLDGALWNSWNAG